MACSKALFSSSDKFVLGAQSFPRQGVGSAVLLFRGQLGRRVFADCVKPSYGLT